MSVQSVLVRLGVSDAYKPTRRPAADHKGAPLTVARDVVHVRC